MKREKRRKTESQRNKNETTDFSSSGLRLMCQGRRGGGGWLLPIPEYRRNSKESVMAFSRSFSLSPFHFFSIPLFSSLSPTHTHTHKHTLSGFYGI